MTVFYLNQGTLKRTRAKQNNSIGITATENWKIADSGTAGAVFLYYISLPLSCFLWLKTEPAGRRIIEVMSMKNKTGEQNTHKKAEPTGGALCCKSVLRNDSTQKRGTSETIFLC
jgi:hypothetical protein